MADISKIKLPDGVTYNIKDTVARASAGGAQIYYLNNALGSSPTLPFKDKTPKVNDIIIFDGLNIIGSHPAINLPLSLTSDNGGTWTVEAVTYFSAGSVKRQWVSLNGTCTIIAIIRTISGKNGTIGIINVQFHDTENTAINNYINATCYNLNLYKTPLDGEIIYEIDSDITQYVKAYVLTNGSYEETAISSALITWKNNCNVIILNTTDSVQIDRIKLYSFDYGCPLLYKCGSTASNTSSAFFVVPDQPSTSTTEQLWNTKYFIKTSTKAKKHLIITAGR